VNTLLFDNIEIRQFRAFDFLKIEQLGHVNLILGKNNVGKSTLLEALYLFATLSSPFHMQGILDERDEPRSSKYTKQEEPALWNLFYGYPPLEQIRESIQIGRVGAPDSALTLSIVWLPDNTKPFAETDENFDPGQSEEDAIPAMLVKYGPMRRILRLDEDYNTLCRMSLKTLSFQYLETPCVFIRPGGLHGGTLQSFWNDIALTDAKRDVIEAMRIINSEIEDFALLPQYQGVHSFHLRLKGQDKSSPVKSMGDGMNRLVGLSIGLIRAKDGILLVDEIENGIHWSVLPDVWRFIVKVAKRLNVQVFATTHSHDCLRAFHFGTKGDPAVQGVAVRLEKREGEFHAEIFDEQRLAVIVKEGIEIR
jgi:energy-coupling factor transporter ATP-binding protein EcfA2